MSIRRREFITLVGGAAAAWPAAAQAQKAMPVIGFLGSGTAAGFARLVAAFRQGLSETGYVEGRNVAIEYRWAEGENDRLPSLAADLVRRNVNVIVAPGGGPAALASKAATASIPIVFQVGIDPVAVGLVASLNRPGGNLTGATSLNSELGPKRLELLHELVPMANIMALLVNPTSTNPNADAQRRDMQSAARTFGVQLQVLQASAERDFDTVFASFAQLRAGALLINADPFFVVRGDQLAKLTVGHAVPTISPYREFATAGGLISYGGSVSDQFRMVGVYTGRILNGEMPADLPVQQSAKVEMLINLKAAKALGLTVPLALLTRADEVIE
jgi:putative ABC transport system substrate-binding protein